ncbi:MAG: ABC transporter permease subunit [Lachnospiraceae bacterium]|nr:ABC transporter permease subunit [Agathobacter sp.]MDD6291957.1 ABC transporter permease subunit [Lachnospiraceae bacterium]
MAQKRKRPKSLYRRMQENAKVQAAATIILPVLLGIIILVLWQTQVLHHWFKTDTFTLPLLGRIKTIFMENIGKIWENVVATMIVALVGLAIGSLLGYGVAILAALFPRAGRGGLSVIGAFASIPVVALAPVMNNWTKDVSNDASTRSMVAKILVVMLIAAANMSLNAYRGLTELKPYAKDLMATYAAKKRTTLLKLQLPNSVPYIFVALKVSVPASIMTAIVSEYFAEYIIGVGRQIRENIVLAQYPTAWAYIATACLLGIVSYVVLMIVQSILLRRYH